MLIDKKGNKYQNLKEFMYDAGTCDISDCQFCPISADNNGERIICVEFAERYPNKALEAMIADGMLKEEKPIPNLCKILGVEPWQEFTVEYSNNIYRITDYGIRQYKDGNDWGNCQNELVLSLLIQNPERIKPVTNKFSQEQLDAFARIKDVLPETTRIFGDKSNTYAEILLDCGTTADVRITPNIEFTDEFEYSFKG